MKKSIATAVIVLVSLCCAVSNAEDKTKNKFTIEVESFKLKDAKIVDLEEPKGAKGVVLTGEKSRAETKVKLTKGRWVASAYMIAGRKDDGMVDYDKDAVYLVFAGQLSRLYDSSDGKAEANFADEDPTDATIVLSYPEVNIEKDGEYTVVFKFAEPGVTIDRIVFRKL